MLLYNKGGSVSIIKKYIENKKNLTSKILSKIGLKNSTRIGQIEVDLNERHNIL